MTFSRTWILMPMLFGMAEAAVATSAIDGDNLLGTQGCASAIPLYRKAVDAHPDDYVSTARLANCLMQVGDNEAAIEWEKKAAEFSTERPNRLLDLAILYTRLKQFDQAFDYLDKALDATGTSYRTAAANLAINKDFEPLHGDARFEAILAKAYGPGFEPPTQRGFSPEKVSRGVELILSTIVEKSPNPYRYYTKAQWRARADEITGRASTLDENSYFWELVSLLGMNGDVHSSVLPNRDGGFIERRVPLRLWHFADGLYIRATSPELKSLLGARILRVGSFDIDKGWDELVKRFPSENPAMTSAQLALYLLLPDFARAMGWTRSTDGLPLTVMLSDGRIETYQVPAPLVSNAFYAHETATWLSPEEGFVDSASPHRPLWQTHLNQNYWYTYLPRQRAIYFAFNLPQEDTAQDYEKFVAQLVREYEARGARRLVIDLRNNPGGLGIMAIPLVDALAGSRRLQGPGRIVVLTSRATQSAGTIIAAQLEKRTDAVFLGEPTGDAPNLFNAPFGNHVSWAIPGVRAFFRYSSVMEQQSDPLDTRNSIYPDVPVWMTFADYSSGRDPVLDRALALTDDEARALLSDPGGRLFPRYGRWRRDTQAPAFPNWQVPRRFY